MGLIIALIAAKAVILYLLIVASYILLVNTALVIKAGSGTLDAKDWHLVAILAVIFYILNTIG